MRSCREEKGRDEIMNDEVDIVLARRLQECAACKRLPSGFADRLVRSVRRRRRLSRIKVAVSLIVVSAFGIGLLGVFSEESPEPAKPTAIIAAGHPAKQEQVSGWMFLGFLRECFKRNRNNKRKEEE